MIQFMNNNQNSHTTYFPIVYEIVFHILVLQQHSIISPFRWIQRDEYLNWWLERESANEQSNHQNNFFFVAWSDDQKSCDILIIVSSILRNS